MNFRIECTIDNSDRWRNRRCNSLQTLSSHLHRMGALYRSVRLRWIDHHYVFDCVQPVPTESMSKFVENITRNLCTIQYVSIFLAKRTRIFLISWLTNFENYKRHIISNINSCIFRTCRHNKSTVKFVRIAAYQYKHDKQ